MRFGLNPSRKPENRAAAGERSRRLYTGVKKSPEFVVNMRTRFVGEKHWNWQGGKTDETRRIRNSWEYRQWRKAVFERDRYTCRVCGQVGGLLNADHIKPFSSYPHLRFDVINGQTLCLPCHKKTATFGYKARKFKQGEAPLKPGIWCK
jgi:hypothetical protein